MTTLSHPSETSTGGMFVPNRGGLSLVETVRVTT
jgi:hypothetical protein